MDDSSRKQEDVYVTRYDDEGDGSLCFEVIRAVSAVTGRDQMEVDPLFGAVDPDALESVVRSLQRSEENRVRGAVEFVLSGCRVTVFADGAIELRPGGDS